MTATEATKTKKPKPSIEIIVNNKPVHVEDRTMTGLEIKQAAIEQGVQIQLNFQLALLKNKKRKIIADDEIVRVKDDREFRATAADDNS